jgi:AcrR family transcriptional regulator
MKSKAAVVPAKRKTGRPVGRPPGVSGSETNQQILDAACACFATYGYAATSNTMVAQRAHVTAAAIYHHFGRKQDLMFSAYDAAMEANVTAMRVAIEAADTFVAKVDALIDMIYQSVVENPENAMFTALARIEAHRHEELAPIIKDRRVVKLFEELVDYGIGENAIDPDDASSARGALAALTLGLAMLGPGLGLPARTDAAEGLKKLLHGQLFRRGPVRRTRPKKS